MSTISSAISQLLPLPPSCIAFCPTQPNLFVVGTYFLHKDEVDSADDPKLPWQKRSGSLMLFRLGHDDDSAGDQVSIRELCTLKTEFAVLDVQWSPHRKKGNEAIAVAISHPMLEFYRLDLSPDGASAALISSAWLGPFVEPDTLDESRDVLALSVAWHPTRQDLLAATLSDGGVSYCEIADDFAEIENDMSVSSPALLRHELEAWTVAFSPISAGVFSGGDDCALRYMRPSWGPDGINGIEASWQDKRLHDAGVTALVPLSDELIVTGSYDDHVRLIYAPPVGRRQILADRDLEGGVWRLKMAASDELPDAVHPSNLPYTCTILASCMHAGTRVLRLRKAANGIWRFKIIARFTEHKSMNYGSDIQPKTAVVSGEASEDANARMQTVVSTSFYDKLLCVWKFDMKAEESALVEEAET